MMRALRHCLSLMTLLVSAVHAQDHSAHAGHGAAPPTLPREVGQDAYAAIAEIVAILTQDAATDWSKVDVEALRQHLRDMQLVTVAATVTAQEIPGGALFLVRGEGEVLGAIRRMAPAHAAATVSELPFLVRVSDRSDAVEVRITAATPTDAREVARIRGLGFIGWIASGGHHQAHHLAIARGEAVHRH